MKSLFKKSAVFSLLLILAANGAAVAEPTQAAQPTPELSLLESLVGSAGADDVRTQSGAALFQRETRSAIDDYLRNHTNDPDLAARNMADALVAMNIYTSAQAHQFLLDTQSGIQKALSANANASSGSVSGALASELWAIARANPEGAQFSGCDAAALGAGAGMVTGAAGALMVVVGGILRWWNPNCETPETEHQTVDNSALGSVTTTTITTPGEVCGTNPNLPTSDTLLKYGAIIGGAGVVAFITGVLVYNQIADSCD